MNVGGQLCLDSHWLPPYFVTVDQLMARVFHEQKTHSWALGVFKILGVRFSTSLWMSCWPLVPANLGKEQPELDIVRWDLQQLSRVRPRKATHEILSYSPNSCHLPLMWYDVIYPYLSQIVSRENVQKSHRQYSFSPHLLQRIKRLSQAKSRGQSAMSA